VGQGFKGAFADEDYQEQAERDEEQADDNFNKYFGVSSYD